MNKLAKHMKRGFTLVELMIVVAIIGVLAALAIYGVSKYVANAKTTEARASVGRMAKDAATAYSRPKMSGSVVTMGESAAATNTLCETTSSVPAAKESIEGKKYQSSPTDWSTPEWQCLQFSMNDPQAYMYKYTKDSATAFSATAQGDLDGDGDLSTFKMTGAVQTDAQGVSALVLSPGIDEDKPVE